MRTIIITATDDKYAPMTLGLLRSLHRWDRPLSSAIGVLDVGMSEQTRSEIARHASMIVEPGWDFDVRPDIKQARAHVRAGLARSRLPALFPDFDLYLWLDADTWVQDRSAVAAFFEAASTGAIALVPSSDRSYRYQPAHIEWRWHNLHAYFGDDALRLYHVSQYYNSGAFCIHRDAPHWDAWSRYFTMALRNDPTRFSDQSVLNYAIWKERLPVYPLPSRCNWLCHYSVPSVNSQNYQFQEPFLPHAPLGILHLAGKSKHTRLQMEISGQSVEFDLGFASLARALQDAGVRAEAELAK